MLTQMSAVLSLPKTITVNGNELKYEGDFPLIHYNSRENSYSLEYTQVREGNASKCTEFCKLSIWVEADGIWLENHKEGKMFVSFRKIKVISDDEILIESIGIHLVLDFDVEEEERVEKIRKILSLVPVEVEHRGCSGNFTCACDSFNCRYKELPTLSKTSKYAKLVARCLKIYRESSWRSFEVIMYVEKDEIHISINNAESYGKYTDYHLNPVNIKDFVFDDKTCVFKIVAHSQWYEEEFGQPAEFVVKFKESDVLATFREYEINQLMAENLKLSQELAQAKIK